MTEVRKRFTSNRATPIGASDGNHQKVNEMEEVRNSKGTNEMAMDPTDVEHDLLTPLINIPGSSNKENSLQSNELEPVISVPRDVSKLSLFTFTAMAIVLFQICCEVMKQLSNYSLQYYNEGRFPIPQTVIVIGVALVKLFATVFRAGGKCPISNQGFSIGTFRSSLRFLVPAVLYGINNNVYFFGITLVAPPIWLILCSFRTIITATTYKFFLKRPVSRGQFFGCFVIVISLVVAKFPDILQIVNNRKDSTVIKIVADMGTVNSTATMEPEAIVNIQSSDDANTPSVNAVPLLAIVLAVIASCNSVGAALYTEHLFKSSNVKGETFLDQQFWMYFYESLVAILLHSITNSSYTVMSLTSDLLDMKTSLQLTLFIAIMCGSIGGIVVASILKLLDNIVKEYTGNTANILTAVLCAILFPDKFEFTVYIMLSMACLFSGIYLYESKKVKTNITSASSESNETARELKT